MGLLDKVAPCAHEIRPIWFELVTVLAFLYFSERKVDIAVVEVGLGGASDATNVVQPVVSILTNVGLDHTETLGDTVEQIAAEKVGIIKPQILAINSARQASVMQIVDQRCRQINALLWQVGRAFSYPTPSLSHTGSTFDFEILGRHYPGVHLTVLWAYQVENASLSIATAHGLIESSLSIPELALRRALVPTRVPGRMEVICAAPTVLLDGAHSPPEMAALTATLTLLFPDRRRIIGLVAFSKGHDSKSSLALLAPLLDVAILTTFQVDTDYGSHMAQKPEELAAALMNMSQAIEIYVEQNPFHSLEKALKLVGPDDLICVTGSFYLAGQIRSWFTSDLELSDSIR